MDSSDDAPQQVDQRLEAGMAAVVATSTAYTADGSLDVARRLREELACAGAHVLDDAWVDQVATLIRSGHAAERDGGRRAMGG